MDDQETDKHSGRIAFLDFLFCWPPKGGADVDVYSVVSGLQKRGFEVCLFVLQLEGSPGRGEVEEKAVPFPLHLIKISKKEKNLPAMAEKINQALSCWQPDVVLLTHGYLLKTALIPLLYSWKLIGRYYANELFCLRDAFHYQDRQPCPRFMHTEPQACRECTFHALSSRIKSGKWDPWVEEYVLSRAWETPFQEYHHTSLNCVDRIVVYNSTIRENLDAWQDKTVVIPGGFSPEAFEGLVVPDKPAGAEPCILMTGRVEDPLKGLAVLREACARLRSQGLKFRLMVTHFDPLFGVGELTSTGWLSHEESLKLYSQTDIVVVPSLWEEAFGLVAVEAMAAGLPVCASRTGGLQEIVVHGETGGLFERGNSSELATLLESLLKDEGLRQAWGEAGKKRAFASYTWDRVIESHYLPLLKEYLT